MVGKHALRPAPSSTEWLSFPAFDALVRIVIAEGAIADGQRPDLVDHVVYQRIGSKVLGRPGHIPARTGDEPIERHGDRVEQLSP